MSSELIFTILFRFIGQIEHPHSAKRAVAPRCLIRLPAGTVSIQNWNAYKFESWSFHENLLLTSLHSSQDWVPSTAVAVCWQTAAWSRGGLLRGVPAMGGGGSTAPGRGLLPEGCVSQHALRQTPLPWTEWSPWFQNYIWRKSLLTVINLSYLLTMSQELHRRNLHQCCGWLYTFLQDQENLAPVPAKVLPLCSFLCLSILLKKMRKFK